MLGQLEAEVAAARSEEDVLASALEQMRGRAAVQDQASQRTAELERNIELNRRLYETYVTRLEGIADREQIQEPDARVISEAVPPTSPSFPQPKLILAMALTGGLLLGLAGMYFAETAEGGYRSARAVESELGLQVATLMPLVESATRDAVEPQDYPAERPRSRYAEALRDALAGVIVGRVTARAPVILVTSTLPGEGKSTFSLSLARVAASDGLNVLLIDADLRRPTIGDLTGLPPGPGLVELLRGEFRLDEILQRDPKTEGLRLVLGSKRLAAPTRLFGGPGFANLLEAARTTFDLIVVDSAPVLAVADAKLLAGLADRVLFLIRYATTRRDLAAVAVRGLVDAGAPRLDAVVSQVDLRVHSRTAARDKGYAYAHLAQYYTE